MNVSNTKGEASGSLFLSCNVWEQSYSKNIWLINNGCNNHMIGNIDITSNIDTFVTYTIKLGDNHYIQSSRKGLVSVLTKQVEVKVVHDVYYVPTLSHNLISVE